MHSISPDVDPSSSHSALLFAAYLERFLAGRRVAVLGDATSGLGAELIGRGARLVHVYDHDGSRVARAVVTSPVRGVTYASMGDDLGVRDGAFDLVIVPDLGAYDDPGAVLARARQSLGANGLLAVATPREPRQGGLGYYELYDALTLHFRDVKMLGGVSLEGYAVVDFSAEGDPVVSVDTSLAEAAPREPVFFLALASHRETEVEPYAIVALPPAQPSHAPAFALEDARLQMAELSARMEATRAELESSREQRRFAEARASEEQRRVAELTEVVATAEPVLRQLESRVEAEARRAEALTARLSEAENALTRMAAEVRARTEAAAQAVRALGEHQAEARQLAAREQALARRVAELESTPQGIDPEEHEALRRQIAALSERLAEAASHHEETHGAEVAAGEAALRERAREIAALRHEVERRGAMVRELMLALEELRADASPEAPAASPHEIASLRSSRDHLAATLRDRDTEVESLRDRLRALEHALRERPAVATQATPAEEPADVIALRAENEALRRALLQEHEARVRAEAPSPSASPIEHAKS
jgi:hypothetical protein